MRFTTIAALAAATTVYAQEQAADPAAAPSGAASGSPSAPSPATPAESSLAATPSTPIANGTTPSAPGSSGAGLAGIFGSLSPQCQQGVMGIFMGGEAAQCLHASALLQALGGGQLPAMGAPRPGASVSAAASSAGVAPSGSAAASLARRQEAVSSAASQVVSAVSGASSAAASGAASAVPSALPSGPAGSQTPTGTENSIIPGLEAYLEQACAAPACSNSTITQIAETILNACQTDLQGAGISNDTVKIIAQLYPTAREAVCLQTSEPPVYDPTAFGPNQQNGTAGANVTSTAIPGPSSASLPGAASTTIPGPASSELPEASAVPLKRQEAQGAPPEGADATTPAAGDASASPAADASASPVVSPAAGNSAAPVPSGPVNGTAGTNSTIPAGNSTANATFCATSLLKGLEEWHGKNLTAADVIQLVTNSTERAKLATYPAANLCNDCVYAAATIVESGAPWLLEANITADTTFESWYGATCPASNASISANGTLPEGVTPSAEGSTFGFPLTFVNATTGQQETTTPNATVTPIGQSENSTNGTDAAWPWPSNDNATAPLPTGPVNGTEPTPSTPAEGETPAPSDAAPSDAAPSDAAGETAPEETPAPEAAEAEPSAAPARRRLRFAREY
jgi:hypothetical protein